MLNGRVQPGSNVAIVGAGPIGLAALLTCQFYSPAQIIIAAAFLAGPSNRHLSGGSDEHASGLAILSVSSRLPSRDSQIDWGTLKSAVSKRESDRFQALSSAAMRTRPSTVPHANSAER